MLDRLVTLWQSLRSPRQIPPYLRHLEQRQDEVERRLEKVMSTDSANRAQQVIHASGRR